MIYPLILSQQIEYYLSEVVLLQMKLLLCAAQEQHMTPDLCIHYLNEKDEQGHFRGRGQAVADWLWQNGTTSRHRYLEQFAQTYCEISTEGRKQEQKEKITWCRRLEEDVQALLRCERVYVNLHGFFASEDERKKLKTQRNTSNIHWKEHACRFLVYCYEEFLGSNRAKFNKALFTVPNAVDFGREEWLQMFFEANPSLEICAFCDEARYYTYGYNEKQQRYYRHTSIDHYLPKSLYPHLACHPYNLIPTCHYCNSSIKGEKDPLQQTPGRLNVCTLPYSFHPTTKRRLELYLNVHITNDWHSFIIDTLAPYEDLPELHEAVQQLNMLYNLPERWREPYQLTRISETLFRRMHQFLGDGKGMPIGFNMTMALYNTLLQLLYYLSQEDQRKDPFAFAMTWMLATLIKDCIKPYLSPEITEGTQTAAIRVREKIYKALMEEVSSWFQQSFEDNQRRNELAEQLLALIPPANDRKQLFY
jgi:hypothetical protein